MRRLQDIGLEMIHQQRRRAVLRRELEETEMRLAELEQEAGSFYEAPVEPERVTFCNWCPNPAAPDSWSHPNGQAAHIPFATDPALTVVQRVPWLERGHEEGKVL